MNGQLIERLNRCTGRKHVLTDPADCKKYNHDATGEFTGNALAVVKPASTAEVSEIVRAAYDSRMPIIPIGGNTGLSGGTFSGPKRNSILISLERLNRIRKICLDSRTAIVEAGTILDDLHHAAKRYGLVFPLIFGARGSCTLGGNLSTNAGGSNVLKYGNVRALCLGLEVVTPLGEVCDLMTSLHKDNTGYSLKDLYIGAEGTLGIITAAVLKLVPEPHAYATAMLGCDSIAGALMLLNRLQDETGGTVEAFEYMPESFIKNLKVRFPNLRLPFKDTRPVWILVEIGTTSSRDAALASDGTNPLGQLLESVLTEHLESGKIADAFVAVNEQQRSDLWAIRESAFEVSVMRHPVLHNDIALPLNAIEEFMERMAVEIPNVAPGSESVCVGHLGDGNLHYNLWLDKCESPNDRGLWDKLMETVEDAVQDLGGTFSAEHGIGVLKLETMARRKDPIALNVMRLVKNALDPAGIMNPGKVLPGERESEHKLTLT